MSRPQKECSLWGFPLLPKQNFWNLFGVWFGNLHISSNNQPIVPHIQIVIYQYGCVYSSKLLLGLIPLHILTGQAREGKGKGRGPTFHQGLRLWEMWTPNPGAAQHRVILSFGPRDFRFRRGWLPVSVAIATGWRKRTKLNVCRTKRKQRLTWGSTGSRNCSKNCPLTWFTANQVHSRPVNLTDLELL